jgi:AraC family transcriptional regulator
LEDKRARLVEKIKTLIIELVQSEKLENLHINLSDYLSDKTGKDYAHISNLFSALENLTIEKYFILQKIERVKELLVYGDLTLSEISYQLGYSSVAHLSAQFKQVTGFSPSEFRKLKAHPRRPLDEVALD